MSRELLKLAFEAIERGVKDGYWNKDTVDVSTRIQKYLAEQAAQPQQEPVNQRAHEVALRQWEHWKQYALELQKKLVKYEGGAPMVLNTAPQPAQRKPLTHEQRVNLLSKFEAHKHEWHAPAILIDMVEAAHGITGEKK